MILATDMAMVISKRFLQSMAQPFEIGQDGISLWGLRISYSGKPSSARRMRQQQLRFRWDIRLRAMMMMMIM